jgi:hypothetical protein
MEKAIERKGLLPSNNHRLNGGAGNDREVKISELSNVIDSVNLLARTTIDYGLGCTKIIVNSISGVFQVGEHIIGDDSRADAVIVSIEINPNNISTKIIKFSNLTGGFFSQFDVNITGSISGATCSFVASYYDFEQVIILEGGNKFAITQILGINNTDSLVGTFGMRFNEGSQRSGQEVAYDNGVFSSINTANKYYTTAIYNVRSEIGNTLYVTFDIAQEISVKGEILIFGYILK